MLGILSAFLAAAGLLPVGQAGGISQTPEELFQQIFVVFTILGTLVGIVVIGYTLLNAYKYRDGTGNGEKADVTRPETGQIPSGSGGGKKLFLSFGISAVIVLSLIVWTYSALLYVENPPDPEGEDLTVEVVGEQFSWQFVYPNGHTSINEMVLPEGATVRIETRTADVFHNFGIPQFRVKTDAMPGHTTTSWFVADETGNFSAHCYEICGAGHSGMDAQVRVLPQDEFEEWYANTEGSDGGNGTAAGNETAGGNETATGNQTASLIDAATAGGVGA